MSRRERISPLRCSGVLLLLSLQRVASQLAHEVRRTQSPWYLIPRGGETFGCGQIAPSLAADSGLVVVGEQQAEGRRAQQVVATEVLASRANATVTATTATAATIATIPAAAVAQR